MELAEVDTFVLDCVRGGTGHNALIVERFRVTCSDAKYDHMRIVDRSLQRLRRQGKIKLAPKRAGWILA